MPVVVYANALCNPCVNSLGTSGVLASWPIDEEYIGFACCKNRAWLVACPLDVPQTYRAIVERRYGQHGAQAVVPAVWVVQLHPPGLDDGLDAPLTYSRRLQPVDTSRSIPLNILAVPAQTFARE